jgi:hypothetical protein
VLVGRVVADGEPLWLPEDLDVIDTVAQMKSHRSPCGHWSWDAEALEGMHLDYEVCPVCSEIGQFADDLREERENMHGVHFAYYPTPREEDHAD